MQQYNILYIIIIIPSCTVCVWECLQSPVGRGSGLACVCPLMSMGCCRVPAGYVLFVPVLFMWNVVVLLLMHLLGAADCVVASYVFVIYIIIIIIPYIILTKHTRSHYAFSNTQQVHPQQHSTKNSTRTGYHIIYTVSKSTYTTSI
jgi:hypothetical protein